MASSTLWRRTHGTSAGPGRYLRYPNVIEGYGDGSSTQNAPSNELAECGNGARSNETVFQWTAANDGPVCLLTTDSDYDTVIHVRESVCGDRERAVGCNDDNPDGGTQSRLQLDAQAGTDYFIFIDGYASNRSGNYVFTLQEGPCVAPPPPGNLVEELQADGRFGFLIQLLELTELDEVLAGGEFTVFAPTDDVFRAFDAANPGVLRGLVDNPADLANILLYHVVAGTNRSDRVVAVDELATALDGALLAVQADDAGVRINYAGVTEVDNEASNGVFHVIDGLLLPSDRCNDDRDCAGDLICNARQLCGEAPVAGTLIDELERAGEYTTLLAALNAAGLTQVLAEGGPFTLLAPNDQAFADLEASQPGIIEALLAEDNRGLLQTVLLHHVVSNRFNRADWRTVNGSSASGPPVLVEADADGVVAIGGAQVSAWDLAARNGVIHRLASVLRSRGYPEGAVPSGPHPGI